MILAQDLSTEGHIFYPLTVLKRSFKYPLNIALISVRNHCTHMTMLTFVDTLKVLAHVQGWFFVVNHE